MCKTKMNMILKTVCHFVCFEFTFLLFLVCSTSWESRPGLNTGLQEKKAKFENTGIDTSASLISRIAFSKKDVLHNHITKVC